MNLIFHLLQQMSIFLVIAYLFTKSPAFRPLTSEHLRFKHKFLLYLIFSSFSILGTYFGLPIQDAIANTRAIGPVLAGLIGGPLLGVATGLTGGLHRYLLGGFTAEACGISTTVEGLIGGLVHLYLVRRGRQEQIYLPLVALGATFYAEAMQMVIILLLAKPFDQALGLVKTIALPMMLANSAGAALFISIIRDQRNAYDRFGAHFSARALKVADRTLEILSSGFNPESARQLVQIIHQETQVGAVCITDRERILAFSGLGADHHLPGLALVSEYTLRAIQSNQVCYADGFNIPFSCTRLAGCPLGSELVVPLHVEQEVIGTIILFEPKSKLFLNLNRSLGEGLANLLSDQLLRARYAEQKNLLVQSELKLVQAQVNPHFLFNALNTIISITRSDAQRACELQLQLSNFFRKNLMRSGELVSLKEEMEHVHSYLMIEEARFEERLKVITRIDPALWTLQIPTFTLQPLIENAIKHGISQVLEGGQVTISVQRVAGHAELMIEDDAGTYGDKPCGEGLGMNIVDKRIKNLFGADCGIEVSCVPQQYTRVMVRIPLPEGGEL
ncbi:sensor histidine kinase [Geopsychrobacter electrodiphilus]|uniref:sensor histidine kinase n=1 Tax=Geopsychrobacter electrodiphilus TaxID=225196 RepID=UPI00036036EE|nr:sensor histidine kinase [Geopsychrobacter electrodiphilus]